MVASQSPRDSDLQPEFEAGVYRHYKGKLYQATDLVRHSETEEWMVLYRPDYGEQKLWVRPYHMFFEKIEVDCESKPRFELLANSASEKASS